MMDAGGRPATGRGCVQLVLGPMFRCVCRLRRTKTKQDAPVAAPPCRASRTERHRASSRAHVLGQSGIEGALDVQSGGTWGRKAAQGRAKQSASLAS